MEWRLKLSPVYDIELLAKKKPKAYDGIVDEERDVLEAQLRSNRTVYEHEKLLEFNTLWRDATAQVEPSQRHSNSPPHALWPGAAARPQTVGDIISNDDIQESLLDADTTEQENERKANLVTIHTLVDSYANCGMYFWMSRNS